MDGLVWKHLNLLVILTPEVGHSDIICFLVCWIGEVYNPVYELFLPEKLSLNLIKNRDLQEM